VRVLFRNAMLLKSKEECSRNFNLATQQENRNEAFVLSFMQTHRLYT